jgi:hypothetical protein
MMNNVFFMQRTGRLTCKWVQTGDPKMPLACVWTGSKTAQTASVAPSADENGRLPWCA